MKRGAVGQTAKLFAKMYVNSKLKEPNRADIYHLLGILFIRWAIVSAPGNIERLRYALPALKATLAEGHTIGLADLVVIALSQETDIKGIELDVLSVVKDVLRGEGIPTRDIVGLPVDKKTLEATFSEFLDV